MEVNEAEEEEWGRSKERRRKGRRGMGRRDQAGRLRERGGSKKSEYTHQFVFTFFLLSPINFGGLDNNKAEFTAQTR